MAASKTSIDSQSNPFIKQLASSDRSIRDRALSSLRTYLHRKAPFSSLDLLKLWKGLFYCMFMSDKPRNQQRLARDLADLVDACATPENTLGFLQAFWKTMAREWSGIDYLRMDKYLYLVRCYVLKGFEVCARNAWRDDALLEQYSDILSGEGGPLSPRDAKVPNGLRLHVLDIWVDELDKADGDRTAPLDKIMAPVKRLGKETLTKSVRGRAAESVDDERLKDWKGEGLAEGDDPSTDADKADAQDGAEEEGEFGGFDE